MEQPQSSLSQQLKALWRFKGRIALIAVLAGAVALIFTSMRSPVYEASTKLMIENGQQRLTAIPSGIQGGLEMTYLQDVGSQIEVMRSRAVLEQAILQLEPDKATDNATLSLAIANLEQALSVKQIGSTNLVEIMVVSPDPGVAQKEANAIAEAYVNQISTLTQTTIENALEDTTKRLEQLQDASVDLAISPTLPGLTAQANTALTALNMASSQLLRLGSAGSDTTSNTTSNITTPVDETGTVITASQLRLIAQTVKDMTSDAGSIGAAVTKLNPVGAENNFSARSAAIADIESRTRVLNSRLGSLATDIGAAEAAETDPGVKDELRAVEEQLQVASSTGGALLDQVINLYAVQEQYVASTVISASATGEPASAQIQSQTQNKQADANLLNRIIQHSSTLTNAMDAVSSLVSNIVPRVGSPRSLFTGLATRTESAASGVQEILHKLQPDTSQGSILLTHDDLSTMEIKAQSTSISLKSLSSDLSATLTGGFSPSIVADLRDVQEQISIAGNAADGLENDISGLATGGSDASYTTLETLRQQLQLALLSGDTGGTRVVDTAVITSTGNTFSRYRGVLLAIIAGLLVGVIAAFIMQYADRKVRDVSQVKNQVGLPLVGNITTTAGNGPRPPSILDDGAPDYLESFRLLRTNLGLDNTRGKVLLVSSPLAEEGKTVIAANLARVVALQGRKVLLIDGNLHYPGIAGTFGLEDGEGLSEFLARAEERPLPVTRIDDVYVLTAGQPSVKSAELLSSPRLKTFLEKARKDYDITIIDSAGIMEWTDTRIMARNTDGVLLVLLADTSRIDMAKESKQALEAVGARLEGFILHNIQVLRKGLSISKYAAILNRKEPKAEAEVGAKAESAKQ